MRESMRPIVVFATSLLFVMAIGAGLFLTPATARAADDDDKDWKVLGETAIEQAKAGQGKRGSGRGEGGSSAGEISPSASEGFVKRIKFEVRGAEVTFKKITVTYEEGDPEEIEVREEKVRNRGRTRTIDLKGGNRAIKKVLLAYTAEKADNDSDRDARIILMGHK